jgi:putative tryptophan/tyrosine transport system substrate-binding protein
MANTGSRRAFLQAGTGLLAAGAARAFIAIIGAAAWRGARAQEPQPVIGFLGSETRELFAARLRAFHIGLGQAGYAEGRNVAIEYRWAEAKPARLPELAADLVAHRVSVIAAAGGSAPARAAKSATSTIPIVFQTGADPVKDGLVAALDRPGGNITGATRLADSIEPERLELLHEAVPRASLIGFLINPSNRIAASRVRALEEPARALGLRLMTVQGSNEPEFEAAFAELARQGAGALSVGAGAVFHDRREALVALAARHALPTMYEERDFATAGGLLSFSAGPDDSYRQLGIYVGRVLAGEKPADLPVLTPGKFELVINRRTAKGLGLEIPAPVLARADEIIE